ncbi:MAG: hypothetical protein A3C80_03480 [Candidatus Ryanbacteria bacterium RIFCSPHIGHO2_02_FULL_45_43]|uniref:Uncharacterized protein n=1 Tax=Candidatus Ryanbacteria bacterium RIFCSPHIGHO2_01_45_13 TaxID=1802112 RepID=A0A1G2FTI9_9BACT|nr:MAG: hypothetical protein A2W41_01425 [Candidatus Ryanbacteria bacterium RIFCSPHIGHO2_01_45_13]OGZ41522.1 MAG: hypothetical protein A2718_03745 [Candidatus Ryanbacteria bacterium RIFCSPHIGHO2_01_FULL_44_130]OGZ47989.1 MAG: hypothetical protein A3C80_03480 [Candidatus Ryanbacteria bacterium RIFCSPHIGHO2_02_FULL_45_43]OGZ50125.1 MAG: hypothetical protein A3E55_01345 [Candidatus Ryanbacteria bacterium RIFCSPHIGHO2_12_FULL_44_20]OGZ51127.1 MAG: hypothetical protein A3A17_03785 [Candidatus Ryanba
MGKFEDFHIMKETAVTPRRRVPFFMIVNFFILLLIGYFVFQASDFLFGPQLFVEYPINGETVVGNVFISGKTDPNTRLTINGFEAYSDDDGFFSENLPLTKGYHDIIVEVRNRFQKEARVTRAIVVK